MLTRISENPVHGTFVSRALGGAQHVGGADVAVTSCTCQADAVRPGDAFVAMDAEGDAAALARQAVDRGAVAIVSERFLPVFGVPQYVVDDCLAAYSALCHAILGDPSRQLNAIAIAGSYGKTSIALVLDSILRIAGKSVATATNQFTRVDGQAERHVLPTTAPAIADFLDESLASDCRHATVELSEETLRSKAAEAATFDVVCLANLHGDRAEGDRSPLELRQSMASALELLSAQGMAVLNADDSHSMRILAEYDGPALTFGLHHPADITAAIVEHHVNEQVFMLTAGDETAAVRTKVAGEAHVQNCLAAAAIASVYGVSLAHIAKGIEKVETVPGVMQRFDAGLGVSVFVDRGQTAVAKGGALSAARDLTAGRVIAVVDAGCSVTDAIADRTIETLGRLDESVVDDAVAKVLAAMDVAATEALRHIAEKLTGIARALLEANEGDVVVASGFGIAEPLDRRVTASVNEQQLIQTLMYELAAQRGQRNAA